MKDLEATASNGDKVAETDADNLTEILMNMLVAWMESLLRET